MLNIEKIRTDFPILSRTVYGRPLVYLDNSATTQLPNQVLECLSEFYSEYNSNIHRGIYYLSEQTTQKYEDAREKVKEFIHAESSSEIVFTQGTTDSVNLIAESFSEGFVEEGDHIIVSQLEHHSNFVPWQMLCRKKGAVLRILPSRDGEFCLDEYKGMLNEKTKLVAVTQVSNLTGTVTPLKEMIELAHKNETPVLVDGAQGIRHENVDVQHLGCDFYCFSGHKMIAPTGIGVLFINSKWLDKLGPQRFGGGMVDKVTEKDTSFIDAPYKFEAGTPNYSGAIALGKAIDYINAIGKKDISFHEAFLIDYAAKELERIDGLRILGQPAKRSGALSFILKEVHPYDLASLLDKLGIAVRAGTHCAQLALKSFDLDSATRISPAFYNTKEEIDLLIDGIKQSKRFLIKKR